MAAIELETLAEPLSEAEPCGPDLEAAGDADFMQFMARSEGFLPTSFFAFDRASFDFDAELKAIGTLLAGTRDIRLLVVLAKLLILKRDLAGFATCLGAIAALLSDRWHDVHPRLEDGDAGMRLAVLHTLDDVAPVVLPLQHAPLAESRRFGAISYRSVMIATGELAARDGEEALDLAAIESAFAEADLAGLIATRDHVKKLQGALERIRTASIEQAGYEQAVGLERLSPLAAKMLGFLDGVVAKRDPSARLQVKQPADMAGASPSADVPIDTAATAMPTIPPGSVASAADAAEALAAVAAYFSRCEPSSPAVLLVRQAEQLIGKSFLEVMRILVPAHVEQATIHIGAEQAFELPLERLSALPAPGVAAGSDEGPVGAAASSGNGADPTSGNASSGHRLEAGTRQDAIALLQQVGAYYRAVEPSSPIPLLTERARGLAERDFLSLLKVVLPEAALKTSRGND